MKLAACGENATPARREITAEQVRSAWWQRGQDQLEPVLTGFGEVESLLAQVGYQAKEGDEASKRRTDDVEVDQGESRHLALGFCSAAGVPTTKQPLVMSGSI